MYICICFKHNFKLLLPQKRHLTKNKHFGFSVFLDFDNLFLVDNMNRCVCFSVNTDREKKIEREIKIETYFFVCTVSVSSRTVETYHLQPLFPLNGITSDGPYRK
jgi:hypothetical protein